MRTELCLGDMVLAVNNVAVAGIADLNTALESIRQSESVVLLIRRGSITIFVLVTSAIGLSR